MRRAGRRRLRAAALADAFRLGLRLARCHDPTLLVASCGRSRTDGNSSHVTPYRALTQPQPPSPCALSRPAAREGRALCQPCKRQRIAGLVGKGRAVLGVSSLERRSLLQTFLLWLRHSLSRVRALPRGPVTSCTVTSTPPRRDPPPPPRPPYVPLCVSPALFTSPYPPRSFPSLFFLLPCFQHSLLPILCSVHCPLPFPLRALTRCPLCPPLLPCFLRVPIAPCADPGTLERLGKLEWRPARPRGGAARQVEGVGRDAGVAASKFRKAARVVRILRFF